VKVGAENRNKAIGAAVLMGIAILLVGRILFFSGAPTPTATTPTASLTPRPIPRGRASTTGRNKKGAMAPHSIDPSLRYDWLKESEDTPYAGNGRNIFIAQAEIPQPKAPGVTDAAKNAPPVPTGPPPPPPITLKFYGFASKAGEPKRIFLSQGEDVFIATEGEIVDRRYKILHITPTQVEVEDVLNNNRQNIPLTQG
jgi:hypothetical protein